MDRFVADAQKTVGQKTIGAKKQSAAEPPGYGSAAEQPDGQQVMWRRAISGRGSLPLELQPWFRPALRPVGVVGTMRFRHHPSRR
ncbi:hypothetical protein M5E06_21410 [Azospirillum sp. A1-3]|uniref:hypothetical protein n=1 Tax=Azospirillum sp. A1-3 TaxID=185874 RepID=UPI0020777986|nr:hypothetical protein [Azospirillum sp. A1-3]MCM8736689.1 hypothetical protein [Azospirillum sp. A1-3]